MSVADKHKIKSLFAQASITCFCIGMSVICAVVTGLEGQMSLMMLNIATAVFNISIHIAQRRKLADLVDGNQQ